MRELTPGLLQNRYVTIQQKALLDIGIVPGSDITPEAALTKLSYVLSKTELSREEKMKLVETNIVGEMTVIKINSTGTENKLRYIIYKSKISRSFLALLK